MLVNWAQKRGIGYGSVDSFPGPDLPTPALVVTLAPPCSTPALSLLLWWTYLQCGCAGCPHNCQPQWVGSGLPTSANGLCIITKCFTVLLQPLESQVYQQNPRSTGVPHRQDQQLGLTPMYHKQGNAKICFNVNFSHLHLRVAK